MKKNFSKKKKVNLSSNNSNYFREKYNSFFGDNTFNKLLEAKKLYSKNQFIRVNTSKVKLEQIEEFLKKNNIQYEKTFISNVFKIVKAPFSLAATPEHLMGWFYIQDLASSIPINCIDWKSPQSQFDTSSSSHKSKPIRILDLCASPGSKTTQLLDTLETLEINYKVIAIEPQQKRLTRLLNNLQKSKAQNIEVFQLKGEELTLKDLNQDEAFDVILLDAPCSGNLIGDRNWLQKREKQGIYDNSKLQKKLLDNAKTLLKKGGILIYSTCSLEVEENEENVHYAIKQLGLSIQKIALKFPFETQALTKNKAGNFDKEITKALRFMPYQSKTEGFFVAVFKK